MTGSRAEYGLLNPVMRAVMARKDLELRIIACGSHLLGEKPTVREVTRDFPAPALAAKVPMQSTVKLAATTAARVRDAVAVGEGIRGLAAAYAKLDPDWVLVLGDRIEAFAAAAAASIGGYALAHVHGGDRAEGIADEAMRHAITKLAHLHLAATPESARRILKMGEPRDRILVTGSPAIDGLEQMNALDNAQTAELSPAAFDHLQVVALLHPAGLDETHERETVQRLAHGIAEYLDRNNLPREGVLVLAPNHDAGRDAIVDEWNIITREHGWATAEHLPRETFIGLLKLLRERGGFLAGNSSAGLVECSALGVAALNVGPRQNGRERTRNVIDADVFDETAFPVRLRSISRLARTLSPSDRFGDGHTGERIAEVLADSRWLLADRAFVRKHCAY